VNITVLSIRCANLRTGLALTLNRWSLRISICSCCKRDRPALYDFRTTCHGAGGRKGETLKELRHFSLHRYKYNSHFFVPLYPTLTWRTYEGERDYRKRQGNHWLWYSVPRAVCICILYVESERFEVLFMIRWDPFCFGDISVHETGLERKETSLKTAWLHRNMSESFLCKF